MEHIVFLTGRLAEPALRRVLAGLGIEAMAGHAPAPPAPAFTWEAREIGVQVAALMTAELIRRRLPAPVITLAPAGHEPLPAQRVIVPGRCRGDLSALTTHYGIPVDRGPEELKDLPGYFRRAAQPVSLDDPGLRIFAEIVDAPRLSIAAIVERARELKAEGADVIDLGGLPDTPFPHLEDSVQALKAAGHAVSVDSMNTDELLRGGRAGADYLLSLNADTLWIASEVPSTPVLIPRTPQDEASLWEAIDRFASTGRPFMADAILDPIPFGFLASLVRYHRLRERYPQLQILIGVGNLTELTEADTSGINALLLGIAAELQAAAILTTQVSAHARRAVREADWARRIMQAAATNRVLPKGLSNKLSTVHDKQPFPDTDDEIDTIAAGIRDPNFRIQVAQGGLRVYNRDGMRRSTDPFELWPQLGLEHDAGHAFYMGVELARAQTAWELGKRYVQDEPLDWGCAVERSPQDLAAWCAPGATLRTKTKDEKGGSEPE